MTLCFRPALSADRPPGFNESLLFPTVGGRAPALLLFDWTEDVRDIAAEWTLTVDARRTTCRGPGPVVVGFWPGAGGGPIDPGRGVVVPDPRGVCVPVLTGVPTRPTTDGGRVNGVPVRGVLVPGVGEPGVIFVRLAYRFFSIAPHSSLLRPYLQAQWPRRRHPRTHWSRSNNRRPFQRNRSLH